LCGKADPSTASEVKDMSQRLDELERKISMISSPSYNLEKRRRLEEWLSRNVYNWDLGRE
jgi:tetrahydromethanopterin S-methyltransferase subunit G